MRLGERLLLIGPNRRSECTIFEQQIFLSPQELRVLSSGLTGLFGRLVSRLDELDVAAGEWLSPDSLEFGDVPAAFARLFTGTALALQRSAGHRVREHGFSPDSAGQGVWAWFEYEHEETGQQASDLVFRLLADLEPGLQLTESEANAAVDFNQLYRQFVHLSRPLVLPVDTEAIISAARRMDIPCVKLEREPYKGVQGDFRIRLNGLLMLGHCAHQHVVDGTFCISRNSGLLPLLHDREALRKKLSELQVPLPRRDAAAGNCVITRHAIRAADRLGYPVVVKPGRRSHRAGVTLDVRSEAEIRKAIERARHVSAHVSIESMVEGVSYSILAVNGKALGIISDGQELPLEFVHETILDLAERTSSQLGSGMLVLDFVTSDAGRPLSDTGGAVVDVDLAPELDGLLPADSPLIGQAAEAFMRWMFPAGSVARIPIVAVTGTNGKTTTCRMISGILQAAGHHTGMVCSDGIYVDGKFEMNRDESGPGAHHRLFECPDVDVAVLEEYFGRILRLGFSFSWCNVAVCTNVTNDHLGRIGTHTVEQMAQVKAAVVLRARDAVVLNADDPHCLGMAARVSARKVCLVSRLQKQKQLAARLQKNGCCVVLEAQEEKDWIVIYDNDVRTSLIAVEDIPATFSGVAGHNIANAMHAAAACYLSGARLEEISLGLASFRMGFETTPGRMNIHDGLPFRVIVDYAHNADGYRKLCEFIDKQPVTGRKIVMAAQAGDRQDKDIKAAMSELAGHFDHYVCRSYLSTRGRTAEEIPRLLKAGLLAAGVSETSISTVLNATEAVYLSLSLARAGDLLVLLVGDGGEIASTWALLQAYEPPHSDNTAANAPTK